MRKLPVIIALGIIFTCFGCKVKSQKSDTKMESTLKALIIDGQSNHGVWPKTTMMMKDYLEQTGMFSVDIARTAYTWQGPHYDKSIGLEDIKELLTMYPLENGSTTTPVDKPTPDPNYSPDFDKYDVIIDNFGWMAADWPEKTKENFEKYMANGGGLVVVHAANNAWGDWLEYNKMTGVGGWGNRNEKNGPFVYMDDDGKIQRDTSAFAAGSHGVQFEFVIDTRASDHPIMKGLPEKWLQAKDELHDRLRGPGENMTFLATAYSDPEKNAPPWDKSVKGSGVHVPMLATINYGKGRVFHTMLGHMGYSMEGVGFITTFQRGAEWAATGKVTQEVPDDFPSETEARVRKWKEE